MSVSSPPLPDEIVIEILKKAPLKSLHRFKWVSKSWFTQINNEVLPQLVQSPNPCIYYYYKYSNNEVLPPRPFLSLAGPNSNRMLEKGISESLDFLPGNHDMQSPNLIITDSCNGLIFCRDHGRKVMKISGVLPGAGESIRCKLVKFPQESCSRERELCSYMGKSRGKLRLASISCAKQIRVWALRDNNEDEWMLEHDCAATFLGLCEPNFPNDDELYIVGFHPVRNALLIMFKHLLYAYDLDQLSFEKFSEFGSNRVFWWSVFSFTPCFAKQVLT